mmetsp:Transcript_11239/g.24721  ORF Transcript_11239/g.24721 Transcript_11239/m.24721 type:complete len:172 (+) Transcript_11239:342-857(+)
MDWVTMSMVVGWGWGVLGLLLNRLVLVLVLVVIGVLGMPAGVGAQADGPVADPVVQAAVVELAEMHVAHHPTTTTTAAMTKTTTTSKSWMPPDKPWTKTTTTTTITPIATMTATTLEEPPTRTMHANLHEMLTHNHPRYRQCLQTPPISCIVRGDSWVPRTLPRMHEGGCW